MKLSILIISSFFLITSVGMAGEKKDCSCPKVSCGPCQKKISVGKIVKFCDWGDINVCRKVVCENVSFYFSCLSKKTKQNVDKNKKVTLDFMYDDDQPEEKKRNKKKRKLASDKKVKSKKHKGMMSAKGRIEADNESRVFTPVEPSEVKIGVAVKVSNGLVVLHRGQTKSLKKKYNFYVGDEILNKSKAKKSLEIKFENGTAKLELSPKTKLIVQDPHSILGRFQPFIYLVYGGLSFTVDMKEGSFDLLAGQILTRSQEGHFGVHYEMAQEGLKVKVESFENRIDVLRAHELSGKTIPVETGNFLSWMSETPGHLFSVDEKQALVNEGFITPVFQMSESRKKVLGLTPPDAKPLFADWSKKPQEEKGRSLASMGGLVELCQAPVAKYQQCAWTCEGNKKGAKGCQATSEKVSCVRRVCNAAGQWGAPTAFASSYGDLCPAAGTRVGDCAP